ncbi:hypothetical protein QYE76_029840 [Lolium multiflorum]|uniref:Caffeoyl-CoA O-methyltransferase n=1 Tax=Lolium multiflorum TaxID=4521 RepID=A0AAD8VFY1_LOLMU|nr:hypothetical protein QYE76_029840 [Lolium multiflorum]
MKGSLAVRAAAGLRAAVRNGAGGGPRAVFPSSRCGDAAAWPSHRRQTACAMGADKNGASLERRRWLHLRRTRSSSSGAAMASNGEVKDIHNSESTKTLLKSDALYEYMLNTMVYPRENEFLRELRLISHHQGAHLLLSLLLKVMGAKKTIEVGVFTGCSVLATALAIPDDGRVVAIDISREYFDLGLPVIKKAGVAHKVDFREGPAGQILDKLIADEEHEAGFDFAFVDADKPNYGKYHEQLLRLVRVGGVLAYDNTLWGGSVAMPDDTPLTEDDIQVRDAMREFNARIAADARVEPVQLPVADGITLCRRVA